MPDVVIVGAGVIGLTTAWELAGRGLSVRLLDRAAPGREASWAGAGIFPPGYPGDPERPIAQLTRLSDAMWPALSEALRETTGVDNGYRLCGGIEFGPGEAGGFEEEIALWQQSGARVERLTADEVRRLEPSIDSGGRPAYRLPDLHQVRNPWHLRALEAACRQRGVEIVENEPIRRWDRAGNRVIAAASESRRHTAGHFILAAGPWADELAAAVGIPLEIVPVRGQIALLNAPEISLRHVLECGPRYVVPRGDGHILIGSTEERAGFEKENTPEAIAGLIRFGASLVPQVATARIEKSWAGLRPYARRGRPWIGRAPAIDNLWLAAGHYRAGLHLSPATARLIAERLLGLPTSLSMAAFETEA